ncbi:hypothetical protein GC194_10580, partial [bacterium]|nr:hypothetical protein [bacterium]
MTHKHDIQAQFVENLKMVCPSNVSLAEELAELLALSSDSVYRRLRCETEFSLSETVKICEYFSVKLPFQTVENQFLPFTPSVYSNDKKGFEEY